MRIDLHTHSTASDGTDPPAGVVREAAMAGLDVVALTDHDTVAGWGEAVREIREIRKAGLTLVPGAEISCVSGDVSLHLLAYLFDPAHEELAAELRRVRDGRVPRAQEMVRRLAAAGWPVTWEQVMGQVTEGATVGRPHIADALVATGVVPDRETAFEAVLHSRSPFYVRHYAVDPVRGVRLVRAAGGVPVLAHPGAARRGRIIGEEVIAALTEAGLAGLEVDHRDHDGPTRARLRRLAADLALFVTGSSDYHGAGKDNRLGENLTGPEVYRRMCAQASGAAPVTVGTAGA